MVFSVKKGNFGAGNQRFLIVLVQTISQYLESHKRLVVPQLGTFIVKEPGRCVLFSELLKRDDGVLRALLCAEKLGELETAGEIDRFVFEVRHAVEHGEEYRLEGFGVLQPGANGTIAFIYEPRPAVPKTSKTHKASVDEKLYGEQSDKRHDEQPALQQGPHDGPQAASHDNQHKEQSDIPIWRRAPRIRYRSLKPEVIIPEEVDWKLSPSIKLNPDPSLRGLRYSKPHKNTDPYSYINRTPRRRIDRFVWIAVAAAAISLAAIAFGYFRDVRERRAEAALIHQQTSAPVADSQPQDAQ